MLSVRPHFSKLEKQKKQKTMFDTGVTMGLAEWIIDDACLVDYCFRFKSVLRYLGASNNINW